MEIKYFEKAEECEVASREGLLKRLFGESMKPVLFLSSGGSALRMLPKLPEKADCSSFTLGVLDERFSNDEKINNFLQLKQTEFFKSAVSKGALVLDSVPRPEETSELLSKRMEEQVLAWILENPKGEIVVTLGVGEDGHTMGIFPKAEDATWFNAFYNDPAYWVRAVKVLGAPACEERITFTNGFLINKVGFSQALVLGENKKEVFQNFLETEAFLEKVPARVWRRLKDLVIYTDIRV